MAMPYRHTQRGTWIVVPCLVFAAFDAAIAWRTGQWLPVVVLFLLIAVAILFSSLTVEVSDSELRWYFGSGLWTYRLPLGQIEMVRRCVVDGGTGSASGRDRAFRSIMSRASMRSSCG